MAMSDSMSDDELLAVGFKVTEDANVASHSKHNAWRYKCDKCGRWHKEREGNECPGCHQTAKLRAKLK